GPDVAAIEHRPRRILGEATLKIDQHFPHFGDRRDHGGGLAHLLALEQGVAECFGIKRKRGRDREYLVVKVSAGLQHGIGHRAIDHPGIEMAIAVVPGEKLAERALSRRRRSVDRDDHENSAPSERIIGMKSGKLVAMKAVSSTLTGLSDASPITSADIAMR